MLKMSERKQLLPKSSSRKEEVVYEVCPPGIDLKKETASTFLRSLPELLVIIESVVNIKNMQASADVEIKIIREMGDNLQKQADAFVKEEHARRESAITDSEFIRRLLNDLYIFLKSTQNNDDVQKAVIETVNQSLQKYLSR